MSPTQRSLALLRGAGYTVCISEHYNAFARVRRDLFGFADIVALRADLPGILAVQTTTGSNVSARIQKAGLLPAYHLWLKCGNRVEFHGWRKLKGHWHPAIVSLPDLFS